DRYLQRLRVLLDPRDDRDFLDQRADSPPLNWKALENTSRGEETLNPNKPGRPVMFVHTFTCNHSDATDVMTAWALAPSHKSQILATFYWEYRQWTEIDGADFADWLQDRKAFTHEGVPPGSRPDRNNALDQRTGANQKGRAPNMSKTGS